MEKARSSKMLTEVRIVTSTIYMYSHLLSDNTVTWNSMLCKKRYLWDIFLLFSSLIPSSIYENNTEISRIYHAEVGNSRVNVRFDRTKVGWNLALPRKFPTSEFMQCMNLNVNRSTHAQINAHVPYFFHRNLDASAKKIQ